MMMMMMNIVKFFYFFTNIFAHKFLTQHLLLFCAKMDHFLLGIWCSLPNFAISRKLQRLSVRFPPF